MIYRPIISLLPFITLSSLSSLSCASEVVKLNNGNSFSGNISDSDSQSVVHLKHPFSKSPIKIIESSIKQINFENDSKTSKYTENIQLINGDHFPCKINSIDQNSVSLNSSVGNHTIQRNQISKIKFNTKSNKVLYTGPGDDLSAWTTTKEGWELQDGTLSSEVSSATASIQIPKLPENHILKFSLIRTKSAPRCRIGFCSDNNSADRKSDHYYMDFNSHQITLYRCKLGKTKGHPILSSDQEMFSSSELNIKIYIDRQNKKLAVQINDTLLKTITEEDTPSGDRLVFKNLQRNGITKINKISVSDWQGKLNDDSDNIAKSLIKNDVITDLKGNIIPGDILNITANSSKMQFKTPFTKNDSIISTSSIQTLEFQLPKENNTPSEAKFLTDLTNGSKLRYTRSQFTDSQLKLEHSILGAISIPTTSLSSINAIPRDPKSKESK